MAGDKRQQSTVCVLLAAFTCGFVLTYVLFYSHDNNSGLEDVEELQDLLLQMDLLEQQLDELEGVGRREHYDNYTRNSKNVVCRDDQHYQLVVVVVSANATSRQHFRHSWQQQTSIATTREAFSLNWTYMFVVNTVGDRKVLLQENAHYNDLLLVDTDDQHSTAMCAMQWVHDHCTNYEFALMLADDLMLNNMNLYFYLQDRVTLRRELYSGLVRENRALENINAKYELRQASYAQNASFIVSRDVVARMVDLFDWQHPQKTGDVAQYFGDLVKQSGVSVTNSGMFMDGNGGTSFCQFGVDVYMVNRITHQGCLKYYLENLKQYVLEL